ncbi:MAG: carboxypeptidase regulatory-like domain-containing protein [Acidobacteriota bacterium]
MCNGDRYGKKSLFPVRDSGFWRRHLGWLLALLLVGGVIVAPVWAQESGLQGYVTDESKAFIPGAEVVVTNTKTGVAQTALTSDVGFYNFTFLKEGQYRVRCSMPGFSTQQTELSIDIGQLVRVNFTLKVGEISQVVDVVAEAERIQQKAQDVGQVIDEKRIRELPLNGRNYLQLAGLSAGVAPAGGPGGTHRTAGAGGFVSSGSQVAQNNIRLDGSDITSRTSRGQLGFEAQAIVPNLDALSEFKVITNNISAEYGYRMGATVIVSTKSGTNSFHGSLFEYHRNSALAANDFFFNKNSNPGATGVKRPQYIRNEFGGTIGGPIIHDRTFFFGSYQAQKTRIGRTTTATVPTAAIRQGDFSSWITQHRNIYDPLTTTGSGTAAKRQQFPNNKIPTARLDPIALKIINLYPLPNIAGRENDTSNYTVSPGDQGNQSSYDFRIDHYLNDSHRIFGRYSLRDQLTSHPGPFLYEGAPIGGDITDILSHNVAANYNATLRPNLTNEARFGWTWMDTALDLPEKENLNAKFGIKNAVGTTFGQHDRGLATFAPGGFTTYGSVCCWPNDDEMKVFDFADNLLWERSNHSFKFGAQFQHLKKRSLSARNNRGAFTFSGVYTAEIPYSSPSKNVTGNGMADFLLGWADGAGSASPAGETNVLNYYSGYAQDDWRISPRLTLNAGLRWELFDGPYYPDPENQVLSRPVIDNDPNYTAFQNETSPTITATFMHYEFPKEGETGGSRDLNNFAPRLGITYRLAKQTVVRAGGGIFYGYFNYLGIEDGRFSAQAPRVRGFGFTPNYLQPIATLQGGLPQLPPPNDPTKLIPNDSLTVVPRDLYNPYSSQWFLDIQHMLPANILLTVGYTGNKSTRLSTGTSRNVTAPLTPDATTPLFNRRRWSEPVLVFMYRNDANAIYNSMTVKAERRFTGGVTFLNAFTWSKNIDYGIEILTTGGGARASQLVKDRWMDRARGYMDREFMDNFSALWELPFGKNRKWLGNQSILNHIIGGWETGAIFAIQSGQPIGHSVSGMTYNNGGVHRGDQVGDPNLPRDERTVERWFNTGFAVAAKPGVYGNVGRNVITGPGWVNIDFLASKEFPMPWKEHTLQFRFEAFNLTNTPHFGAPNTQLATANAGRITATNGDPRLIQFALRYGF